MATIAALAVLAAACGGSGDAPATGEPQESGSRAATGAASVDFTFLGDLVGETSSVTTVTFTEVAASAELSDGTRIETAAGAFAVPTEVRAETVELDLASFVENPPWARIYVLSTVGDIELGAPVILEVPRPSDGMRVTQLIDGQWREVTVPFGPTTRVDIPHFSTVPTVVVEAPKEDPRPIGPDPEESPAQFLTACLFAIGGPTLNSAEYGTALAFSLCARALVDQFTPTGERVSVACVGDRIGGEVRLQQAIASCIAEPDESGQTAPELAEEPVAAPAPAPRDNAPTGAIDSGRTAWDGDMTLDSTSLVQQGQAWFSLTRKAGTDTFELAIRVATTSTSDFFEIGECTTILEKTFDGSGTFDPEVPDQIVITGKQFVDWQYPDCSGIAENDNTRDHEVWIRLTDAGLESQFEGFVVTIPGPNPVPFG